MTQTVLLLLLSVALQSSYACTGEIVQFVEDGCSLPAKDFLIVSKPSSINLNTDTCNTTYAKSEWQETPSVSYGNALSEKKYALVMADPDAINIEKGEYYWHWLAANIPGEELKTGKWKNDYSLLKYKGPKPPQGTGLHRYQWLLYEHEDSSKELKLNPSDEDRKKFVLGNWIKSVQNQVSLCGPIAGLQLISQF